MYYYESESRIFSKPTISTVNSLHICWNLDATFIYVRPVAMGAFRGSVPKFSCAQNSLF